MSCSALFCKSRTTKKGPDLDLSFHKFPNYPEIRSKWIKAVRRKNWKPNKFSRLCSKHFEKSCFLTGLTIKKLKSDAVPTIFEENPINCQSVATKRKHPSHKDLVRRKLEKMEEEETIVESGNFTTSHRRADFFLHLPNLGRQRSAA